MLLLLAQMRGRDDLRVTGYKLHVYFSKYCTCMIIPYDFFSLWQKGPSLSINQSVSTYTHTHTQIYTYVYICVATFRIFAGICWISHNQLFCKLEFSLLMLQTAHNLHTCTYMF